MISIREFIKETFAITLSLMLFPVFLLMLAISYFDESDEERAANSYEKVFP